MIGRFGNANPEYPLDWITMDTSSYSAIIGTFTSSTGVCQIEAGAKMEVFVSKVSNSQYQVISASLKS